MKQERLIEQQALQDSWDKAKVNIKASTHTDGGALSLWFAVIRYHDDVDPEESGFHIHYCYACVDIDRGEYGEFVGIEWVDVEFLGMSYIKAQSELKKIISSGVSF